MKYVFSARVWFVKTLTGIVKYESQAVKLNPGYGVDAGCFQNWFTNFECTNLGMFKFKLKYKFNLQKPNVNFDHMSNII